MVLNLVKLLVNFYSTEEYSEVDDSIEKPIQECREEANELIMKLKSGYYDYNPTISEQKDIM
jgi:hypothetical protein